MSTGDSDLQTDETTADPSQPAPPPEGPAEGRGWPQAAVHWLDTLPQGSVRIGRFTVLERVAAGGMGVVYAAYDSELDRKVALKVLREGVASETVRARIVREARAMAKLSHPNVAQVFEVGEYLGSTFIAMEFVQGVTLRQWQRDAARSWREVLGAYVQAGRGLAAAHAEGLVHRDFKPDNAMIGRDGRVRVLDFGLVRAEDRGASKGESSDERFGSTLRSEPEVDASPTTLTQTGSMLGTPAYMAPEQFLGQTADHRSDQFSLCVALWEALLGERPFAGETREGLVANVLAGRLHEPPRYGRLPPWVRTVLARGLALDPARRYASMDALLAALEADPSRRRRRALAAAVGASALALAAAGYGLERAHRMRTCEDEAASIEEVWGDGARTRVRESLMATGKGYAWSTWERVEPRLDEYAAAWAEARESTCLATEVEGTRDEAAALRTRECLDGHRDALATLVDVLEHADETVVTRAVSATAELPRLEECTDEVRLAKRPQPPDDPQVRAEVLALRKELARVAGLSAFDRGQDGRARIEAIVTRAEALGWPPLLAEALVELGGSASTNAELDVAEQACERAFDLAMREGHDEAAHRAASQLVHVTGSQRARLERGRWWGELALALAARMEPVEGVRTAATLERLGTILTQSGEHGRAGELFERAISIRERMFGTTHPAYAEVLGALAKVRITTGEHAQAQALLERALATTEAAFGPDHPAILEHLRSLALSRMRMGAHDEGRALASRAIAIAEAAYGPMHHLVANQLVVFAAAEFERGELAAAKAITERALEIDTRTFGPDHVRTAKLRVNLALFSQALGDHAEVEALYERALAVMEETFGPDHEDVAAVLGNLAEFHDSGGAHAEAEALYERTLAIMEKALGPVHLRVAAAHQGLARARGNQARYAASKASYEAALAIYDQTVGLAHFEAVPALLGLGEVLVKMGRFAEAKARLEEAQAQAQSLAPDHHFVPRVLAGLAALALAERRFADASSLAERAVALDQAHASAPHKLARSRFLLAQAVLHGEGDRTRALALAEQARDDYARDRLSKKAQAEVEDWLAAQREPAARVAGRSAAVGRRGTEG